MTILGKVPLFPLFPPLCVVLGTGVSFPNSIASIERVVLLHKSSSSSDVPSNSSSVIRDRDHLKRLKPIECVSLCFPNEIHIALSISIRMAMATLSEHNR